MDTVRSAAGDTAAAADAADADTSAARSAARTAAGDTAAAADAAAAVPRVTSQSERISIDIL